MSIRLESEGLSATLDPERGCWGLQTLHPAGLELWAPPPQVETRRSKILPPQRTRLRAAASVPLGQVETRIGAGPAGRLVWPSQDGASISLEVALPAGGARLLLRITVSNESSRPHYLGKMTFLRLALAPPSGRGVPSSGLIGSESQDTGAAGWLYFPYEPGSLGFYSNGWQSWGFSGSLGVRDRFPRTRFGPLTAPMRVNAGTPQPRSRGRFASDMFAVLGDRRTRIGLLAGFLSQRAAFGTIEANLSGAPPWLALWANGDDVRLDPGHEFTTDWAYLQFVNLADEAPLVSYLDDVAVENQARTGAPVPVGWCSWYIHFDRLQASHVEDAAAWAASNRETVPLEIVQIDDGYEAAVGDWYKPAPGFGEGVASLAPRIRDAGLTPGLWLAPFVAGPHSRLALRHPDWVLRNALGLPANPGFLWNTFPRALDVTHPEVLEHVRRLVHVTSQEWGFRYLKLDFLYAGALRGERHDAAVTRAQALRRALEAIRAEAGEEVYLLGCGCPLGSGIGIFDAMRIGADVAPRWRPSYHGIELPFRAEMDLPSVRNAVRNTLTRSMLHRRWWTNDPDCVLLRSDRSTLTEAEVRTLATVVSLSGGALMDSDDLAALSDRRRDWLATLLPLLSEPVRVLDWFDRSYPSRLLVPLEGALGRWCLAAFIQWDDFPRGITVPLDELGLDPSRLWSALEFWSGDLQLVRDGRLAYGSVPAHGVRLAALRPAADTGPRWIGDNLHISQGLAVREVQIQSDGVRYALDLGRRAGGEVWLGLPRPPTMARLDGADVLWRSSGDGVYIFDLAFQGRVNFLLQWT